MEYHRCFLTSNSKGGREVEMRARERNKAKDRERQEGREQLWEVGDNCEVSGRVGQSWAGRGR